MVDSPNQDSGPHVIPTKYRGFSFRSRLEARWAVFMDTLGVRWEYEPEAFSLPSGPYLPDFWLPDVRAGDHGRYLLGTWLEIKGTEEALQHDDRLGELVATTKQPGVALIGSITDRGQQGDGALFYYPGVAELDELGEGDWGDDGNYNWIACSCGQIGLQHSNQYDRMLCCCSAVDGHQPDEARIDRAFATAETFRFWEPPANLTSR